MAQARLETDSASTKRTRWLAPSLWLLASVAYVVLVNGRIVGETAATWITDIAWTASAAVTAIGCFQASRVLDGHLKRAWRLFGIAFTLWLVGQLIWNWNELVRGLDVPFPSSSDLFFTAFGLVSIAALFALREPHVLRPLTARNFGNLGLIVCSLAVAIVTATFEPIAATEHSLLFVSTALIETLAILLAFLLWPRDRPAHSHCAQLRPARCSRLALCPRTADE
jgi:hypothetical protein